MPKPPTRNLPVNGRQFLFDRTPMVVGGFRLKGRSIEPIGRPTIKGFQQALALASELYESSPYVIGGLIAYSESRDDWKEKLSQAMTVTHLARHTLENLASLYRHTTETTRALAPSPAHAAEVVTLPEVDQAELLSQARAEELTVRELRQAVQSRKRRTVLDGQAATMHTVDVTVQVTVEAQTDTQAQDAAWALVRTALSGERSAKVIAAKDRRRIA